MRMKDKKGVSLVEVVVAMAVIVTVSVTALSVALSSARMTDKAALRFCVVNQIEDIVTLAESAESEADFRASLQCYFDQGASITTDGDIIFVRFDTKKYNLTVKLAANEIIVSANGTGNSFSESKSFPKSWGAV